MQGVARPDPSMVEFVSGETPDPADSLTEPEAGGCRTASGNGGGAFILLALGALLRRRLARRPRAGLPC